MRVILLLILLAACGRSLTTGELLLMQDITGERLQVNEVRLQEAGFIGTATRTYPTRPRTTCQQRIGPPPAGPTFETRTAGAVVFTHVLTSPDWTLPDYLPDYPERFNLIAAMFFAHEMVHIWQWQNRDITGYHPLRGAAEHRPGIDPYLFNPQDETPFLEMGYEQQAALVEEFICCRTLAPEAARTERLWQRLSAALPVTHPSLTPRPTEVGGIHEDADLAGICD